jgi:fructosamine-3-kinase
MHRQGRGESFGFPMDNYIGSTPQPNERHSDWHEFFAQQRLGFQVKLALDSGKLDSGLAGDIERIQSRLPDLLPNTDHPALLHGDLWGGNYMVDSNGDPVLIDPATYYGHREADLAMTQLFGGFRNAFYEAYEEEWPLERGFSERADLYNLYHMLNHLNIFGGGYLGSVRSIVRGYR